MIIGKSVVFDSLRMLPSQALAIKNPIRMLEKSKDKLIILPVIYAFRYVREIHI